MKNKSVTIIVVLCVLCVFAVQTSWAASPSPEELSYSFDFTRPVIAKAGDYDRISMEGCEISHQTGRPLVPVKGIAILVPEGKEVAEIICEQEQEVTLPGEYFIAPAARPYPLSKPELIQPAVPDAAIYNSNTPYPPNVLSRGLPQTKKGYDLMFVSIYPVRYIPVERKLSYFERITIKVVLRNRKQLADRLGIRDIDSDRKEISRMVVNPEILGTYGK